MGAFILPAVASAGLIDYRAVIIAEDSAGSSLGFVAADPNYWTPLLTPNQSDGLIVDFTLNGTSGTAINMTTENSNQAPPFAYFGLVEGRDNTSSDIESGNFNYLYLGNTNATAPGATPANPGNYFSQQASLNQTSESAVWTIDTNALTLVPVWVNTDGSTPPTVVFVQSNHVYGGGDSGAFHSRFPAPVTDATLHLEILSVVPETTSTPEPASMGIVGLGLLGLGMLRRGQSKSRR